MSGSQFLLHFIILAPVSHSVGGALTQMNKCRGGEAPAPRRSPRSLGRRKPNGQLNPDLPAHASVSPQTLPADAPESLLMKGQRHLADGIENFDFVFHAEVA